MQNAYAKEYYDTYLKQLPTDYKSARWFSSPAARLDFDQTKAVLEAALEGQQATSALEIGPGDGVWTDLIIPHTKKLTLLDQSVEMINRAKERLKLIPDITFINGDFLAYTEPEKYDLICAVRCFEYFEDKEKAMSQFSRLLNPGGKLIIVTKNPAHARMQEVQQKELHTGQIDKVSMQSLLSKHGLVPERTLSATWRFKSRHGLLRVVFRVLHFLHVQTHGYFVLPYLTDTLTESYIYVAKKQ